MSPPNLKLILRNGYATSVMLLVHKNRVRSQPLAIRQELVVNVQHISAVIFFHVFLASSEQSGILRISKVGGCIHSRVQTIPNSKKKKNSAQLGHEVSLRWQLAFLAAAS